MATPAILGLDIGGANLKALAELVAKFDGVEEFAVTMTGELCDCFETKRAGVDAIIKAVRFASEGRRIRVWSTDGVFLDSEQAKANYLKVAAANWHALATLAGQYVPNGTGVLIDTGSTTTDVIPLLHGKPVPRGKTDTERMQTSELIYTGARRTPVCAILGSMVAAELFATAHDAYLLLGKVAEDPADCDTADGRPATKRHAHARLARMLGGDAETIPLEKAVSLGDEVMHHQIRLIEYGVTQAGTTLGSILRRDFRPWTVQFILSGSGEFIGREVFARGFVFERDEVKPSRVRSLGDRLGPEVSACAPAYAVAVLATESRS